MQISYRKADFSDIALVMDSWLNSWKKCPWAGVIRNNHYYPQTRGVVEELIMRGGEIEVACRDDKPDHILGWICREVLPTGEAVIHYVYVKEPYLPLGIGNELVKRSPGVKPGFYTFRYRQVSDSCKASEGWRHAPEIARRK
jgi:hypothetical protein